MCGVMTSVHADALEGRNAAGGKLGKRSDPFLRERTFLGAAVERIGRLLYWDDSFLDFYPPVSSYSGALVPSANPASGVLRHRAFRGSGKSLDPLLTKMQNYECIENYACREFTLL